MRAFYNEIDRYCCDWLQNLMDAGHITPGKIDDRSIADLSPDDVRGYERVHFFAGIAGWELALSLSGYAGPVWTGSCPCQPFSAAGKGKASGDERHLWPAWFSLIRVCRPPVIFGEQVEAAIGWGWLDLVHSDLEPEGYTVGAAVLPACGVGAPHIRQRLWFVADAECGATERHGHYMAESQIGAQKNLWQQRVRADLGDGEPVGELADSPHNGQPRRQGTRSGRAGATHNFWSNLIWLPCTDGKQRPTQPGIFPLAHGVSARVGKLRAAGNAIVPQVAAEFIRASMT